MIFLLLAFALTSCIVISKVVLQAFTPAAPPWLCWLAAWLCNFEMTLYIPGVNARYLGSFTGTIWHNSTYILMKPLALLALYYFIRIRRQYLQGKPWKLWFLFLGTLFFCTWVKPNFFFIFAPAMLALLLVDFFRLRGKRLAPFLWFGSAVFPSVFILWHQYVSLWGGAGEGGGGWGDRVVHGDKRAAWGN